MIDDVFKLVEALDGGFLDVQADAATAIAGLTSDGEALLPTALALSNKQKFAHYRDLRVFMCRSDIGQDMQETGSCSIYVYSLWSSHMTRRVRIKRVRLQILLVVS